MTNHMIEIHPNQYAAVLPLFDVNMPMGVRIVSTLEGRTPGKVFVDKFPHPNMCALVIRFYNITFLGGRIDQNWIDRVAMEFEQAHESRIVWPAQYRIKFDPPPTCKEIVDRFEFYNRPTELEPARIPAGFQIREMDRALLERCDWCDDIVLAHGSPANFLQHGIGLCLMAEDKICCEAYAVWRDQAKFEIGVITHEAYRKRGFAAAACSHLIKACKAKGYSTYWVCHQSNLASAATARKLGYRIQKEFQWLVIPKASSTF